MSPYPHGVWKWREQRESKWWEKATSVRSLRDDFLLIQLVYQGKTTKCLPSFDFPPSWDITFSDNHWSNEQTMLSYFEIVIFPYLQMKKAELQLKPDHPALLLYNFKVQKIF